MNPPASAVQLMKTEMPRSGRTFKAILATVEHKAIATCSPSTTADVRPKQRKVRKALKLPNCKHTAGLHGAARRHGARHKLQHQTPIGPAFEGKHWASASPLIYIWTHDYALYVIHGAQPDDRNHEFLQKSTPQACRRRPTGGVQGAKPPQQTDLKWFSGKRQPMGPS